MFYYFKIVRFYSRSYRMLRSSSWITKIRKCFKSDDAIQVRSGGFHDPWFADSGLFSNVILVPNWTLILYHLIDIKIENVRNENHKRIYKTKLWNVNLEQIWQTSPMGPKKTWKDLLNVVEKVSQLGWKVKSN